MGRAPSRGSRTYRCSSGFPPQQGADADLARRGRRADRLFVPKFPRASLALEPRVGRHVAARWRQTVRRLWIMLALLPVGLRQRRHRAGSAGAADTDRLDRSARRRRRGGARRAAQSPAQSRRGGAPARARIPRREGHGLRVSKAERGGAQGHGNGDRRGRDDEAGILDPCSRPALRCSTSPTGRRRRGCARDATRALRFRAQELLRASDTPSCASGQRSASGRSRATARLALGPPPDRAAAVADLQLPSSRGWAKACRSPSDGA